MNNLIEIIKLLTLWVMGFMAGALFVLILGGCTTIEKGDFRYQSTIFDKKIDDLYVEVDDAGTVRSIKVKNFNSSAAYVAEAVKAVAK